MQAFRYLKVNGSGSKMSRPKISSIEFVRMETMKDGETERRKIREIQSASKWIACENPLRGQGSRERRKGWSWTSPRRGSHLAAWTDISLGCKWGVHVIVLKRYYSLQLQITITLDLSFYSHCEGTFLKNVLKTPQNLSFRNIYHSEESVFHIFS